jgi:cytochrome c oxidase subunit 3
MWMGLAGITMVFAAFTSALVVRKGAGSDWAPTALPPVLYLNTIVLLASSLTLELSRRSLASKQSKQGARLEGRFLGWWYVTLILGGAFIAGQLQAWRELSARGVYLSTNPSSSFFYLLTAAHGLHLLGGIAALTYVAVRARGGQFVIGERTAVDLTALYWHFMDGLWVYILFLLVTRL